jgi:hypothetical protein
MKGFRPVYGVYLMILTASFGLVWMLPADDIFRSIASFPGSAALFGILYQVWRDQRAHERQLELQDRQQDFALGTASHMATVAYNKHVEFCEEYLQEVLTVFETLNAHGATREAAELGGSLVRLRLRHAAWLTSEIEENLKPFETALISMGAKNYALEDQLVGEHRTKIVDEIYEYFRLLMGVGDPDASTVRIAREDVIEELRTILGINALTTLRHETVGLAIKRLRQN